MSKYSSQTSKTTSLLKDNSWIKKLDNEEENVDQDPNFGKYVLGRNRSNETLDSSAAEGTKTTKTISTSTSVHALSKRFGGSQDELRSSPLPSSKTTSTYTKSTYSTLKSDSPKSTTTLKTIVTEEPKTGTATTTVTKDGKTTTETIITTTQSVRSPVLKSPTETFTERVKSSSKGVYSTYSPTKTTKVTETTVTSNKNVESIPSSIKDDFSPTDSKTTVSKTETVLVKSSNGTKAGDHVSDKLISYSIKDASSPKDSKTTVSSTETVTVKSSGIGDGFKNTPTTKTSSTAEDDLYDTLLPKYMTSNLSSPVSSSSITKREIVTVDSSRGGGSPTLASPSSTLRTSSSYSSYTDDIPTTRTTSYTISSSRDNYSSDRKSYSYSRPDSSYEYNSVTSPSVYTTTSYRSSRSDDSLADPIYSKSSMTSVYASPERTVLEKDLCTICRKPFTGDAKMVLDDMQIKCHASCFKCEVCNSTLGHMKAGDSMWIYKRMVHCENCFEVTREKWRR
ncbi:sciellin isoform X5 [Micropterus salmoides]|uniref:sciellin isoform X5 n=1 Tax=Micropterus salmoides TaxID=27706 RepID=UPI0018EB1399|nr:sciellin isoform X5 [Micropterus salmoides]